MSPEVLGQLAATSLDDVFVAGFLDDEESPPRFHGQFRLMYLELGNRLVELRCVEDTGTVKLTSVSGFSNAHDLDDDARPCVMSLRALVLDDPDANNEIEELKLFGATFNAHDVTCSAAEFVLKNGQVLFLDPSYHFGIRFGGGEQRDLWCKNNPEANSMKEWSSLRDDRQGRGVIEWESTK